jgi:hypothetical protein
MSLKTCTKKTIAAAATALGASFGPALILGFALTQPACFLFGSSGPSMVGQGKKYQSGDPQFDEYFAELYELQIEMGKAPAREKEIRQDIAKVTHSDPDTSASMLAKKVEKRTQEIAEGGSGARLEVEGAEGDGRASVKLELAGKELSGDDKSFLEAIEKAARDEAQILNRMREISRTIERMRALSVALDQQVDTAFRKGGPSKKSEVRKNLDDSRTLMPLMVARASETAEAAKNTLKRLSDAVDTKDSFKKDEPPPPPPIEEGGPPIDTGDPKPKPKPGTGTPGTQPPKPPQPQPKPPPPDFEP